uniref:Uncharacterized protein n=1 Tax=Glossina austeni TaxID=7395 RepID=A0A1A9V6S0_GLOAU
MKRGFNKYPKNNYESTIPVSSPILRYEKANKDSATVLQKPEDLLSHHEISINKDWQPSTSVQSDGHIVWSHPYIGDHNYGYELDKTDVHMLSQSPASLGNYHHHHHHHHAGSVFSNDLPAGNILESAKLHTNTLRDFGVSKNIGRRKVSDNIDFNNAFHKHKAKGSYDPFLQPSFLMSKTFTFGQVSKQQEADNALHYGDGSGVFENEVHREASFYQNYLVK